ncbi:MAG: tetratricopeptide repeat protein [Gemmatimonadota bacterium]
MSDVPSYQRLFAELKRRRVFRVMTLYGIVGFVLLQVVDLAVPALLLPDWTYRLVAFLLLLGFPVAVVIAWAFEATPEGLRRHDDVDERELRAIVAAPASKRWPAGLLAVAGVGLLVWGAWHVGRSAAADAPDAGAEAGAETDELPATTASIAVLPFVNMSADTEQEYFSDGISEELLNLLAHVPELKVAARTSSFAFKGQNLGIPEIANQLGVEHVLEGSVRKSGEQVRITAQLIRAEDGFHLWSKTWERTLDDIFAIQDEIAADVVEELQVRLLGSATTTSDANPEAFNLVLQARHLVTFGTPESVRRAGELFEQSLAIDSTYAAAWVGLARQRFTMGGMGLTPMDEASSLSAAGARRALEIDPRNAEAHAVLGSIALLMQNDPRRAAEQFDRALELDPTNHEVLRLASQLLRDMGRFDEARAVLDYVAERDPVNPATYARRGQLARMSRRYDDAIELFRQELSLNPGASGAHYEIALSLLLKGEPEAALETIADEPDEEYRTKITAVAQHELGRTAEHEAAFRELRERWSDVWPSEIAQVYAWKGEADAAFEWLDRAVEQNEDGLDQQYLHPYYDPIRDDPRWRRFLERTGTAPEQLAAIEFTVPLPR